MSALDELLAARMEHRCIEHIENSECVRCAEVRAARTDLARLRSDSAALSRIRAVLETLRPLEGKATKGPWVTDDEEIWCGTKKRCEEQVLKSEPYEGLMWARLQAANPRLIVALRNAYPAMREAAARGGEGHDAR